MGGKHFIEWYPGNYGIALKIKNKIIEKKSQYQKIEIYETENFGKMLVIDEKIQLLEKGEKSYHEPLVHTVLLAHPNPRRILIIGGGDGCAVREVLRYDIDFVEMVEIDREVIEISMNYLKIDNGVLKSLINKSEPRASLTIEDGVEYIKNCKKIFDVVIVDSTDPVKAAKPLFSKDFYKHIYNILDEKGLFITQAGSLYFLTKNTIETYNKIEKVFDKTHIFIFPVKGYASPWSFVVGVKGDIDFERVDLKKAEKLKLEYYDPWNHRALFYLPRYLKDSLLSQLNMEASFLILRG